MTASRRLPRRRRQPPATSALVGMECLAEPSLEFAGGRQHIDQKTGLSVFGPASLGAERHPERIRLGFVGSGVSVESAVRWFNRAAGGVPGDEERGLLPFPGFRADRGFFADLALDHPPTEILTQHELDDVHSIKRYRECFQRAVALVADKLRLLSQRDDPPDAVILALPDELLAKVESVDYREKGRGLVHRDFRRVLKAEAMSYRLPTQIIRQRTSEARPGARDLDHPSRVAWNLLTCLYYKTGGVPWRPTGLAHSACFVGISFYRPLGSTVPDLCTAVAQAFDEDGEGLILRGPDFRWDEQIAGRTPHLSGNDSSQLIRLVLRRYQEETRRVPARVVVHKTSRFSTEERDGFRAALKGVTEFDLVAVRPTDEVRLVRAGRYPPLRGTLFSVGEPRYLYTTGFVPALRAYPHGHVPSPLELLDHHGDSSPRKLAEEILLLTKMNWNSAGFAGSLPITVRFSRLVGHILREVSPAREPEPQFKYYT